MNLHSKACSVNMRFIAVLHKYRLLIWASDIYGCLGSELVDKRFDFSSILGSTFYYVTHSLLWNDHICFCCSAKSCSVADIESCYTIQRLKLRSTTKGYNGGYFAVWYCCRFYINIMECSFKEIVMSNNYSDMIYNNTTEKRENSTISHWISSQFKKRVVPDG